MTPTRYYPTTSPCQREAQPKSDQLSTPLTLRTACLLYNAVTVSAAEPGTALAEACRTMQDAPVPDDDRGAYQGLRGLHPPLHHPTRRGTPKLSNADEEETLFSFDRIRYG